MATLEKKSPYRGSIKHKARPGRGRKGTQCPEWTHRTPGEGLGIDMFGHEWIETVAHQLFLKAENDESEPGRLFATMNGIAFEAKPTNDGTWHGYPVPWEQVPADLKDKWIDAGKISARDLERYLSRPKKDIKWALGTDED